MKKILITSGGTREPIDGVRVIANSSTGATGVALADAFLKAGFAVTLLRARQSVAPLSLFWENENSMQECFFITSNDLDKQCQDLLSASAFDLVIHAAAVSDFVVEAIHLSGVRYPAPVSHKLPSTNNLTIDLVPGKKILPHLKIYSEDACHPAPLLIGFKLTQGANEAEIRVAVEKVLEAGADLVVHNDTETMQETRAVLWDTKGPSSPLRDTPALCDALIGYAKERLFL